MVKIDATEAEIIPSIHLGQAPKTLNPTFPIKQLNSLSSDPSCLVNAHVF